MKKILITILVVAVSLPLFADKIKHRFLVSNYMGKSLHYVDQIDPLKSWNLNVGYPVFDMQLLDGDKLMVNQNTGYHVYNLKTREKVDTFSSKKMKGIKSMRRLKDGRHLLLQPGGGGI